MSTDLKDDLLIFAEYPYYRSNPENWFDDLSRIKNAGIHHVSFYIPWRFHEVLLDGDYVYDFAGRFSKQRDIHSLLDIIANLGLLAIVKPGPFIHAEVQFGGLPDRLIEDPQYASIVGINGDLLKSQGKNLPSFFCKNVRREMGKWLQAVNMNVVDNCRTIVAIQLGNEGIYSDASFSWVRQDFSAPAIENFSQWLEGKGIARERVALPDLYSRHFEDWSAAAFVDTWDWIAAFFGSRFQKYVNVPLVNLNAKDVAFESWMIRSDIFVKAGYGVGHTEWIGNVAYDSDAFLSHVVGVSWMKSDAVEINWGFVWTDHAFARPNTPLFHCFLDLMLGSKKLGVYTVCSTNSWGDEINMDEAGLIEDGFNPRLYDAPYCPGAPLMEGSDATCENKKALDLLLDFRSSFGRDLLGSRQVCVGELGVDRTLFSLSGRESWDRRAFFAVCRIALFSHGLVNVNFSERNSECDFFIGEADGLAFHQKTYKNFLAKLKNRSPSLVQVSNAKQQTAIIRRENLEKNLVFIGLFNPCQELDEVQVRIGAVSTNYQVQGGHALILVIRGDALAARYSTNFNQ